jgi:CheY-like chemotaxis protein
MEEKEGLKILYLEDDKDFIDILLAFRDYHHINSQITHASTVEEAIELFESQPFDAILCDYHLAGEDGVLFLEYIRKKKRNSIPFAIITEDDSREVVIDSLNKGADYFFEKAYFLSNSEKNIEYLRTILSIKNRLIDINRKERIENILRINAHDIKNSLTIIGMSVDILRGLCEKNERIEKYLENIAYSQRAIRESIEITTDCLNMGKNYWISFYRMIKKLNPQFPDSINIINKLPEDLEIFCDMLIEKAFYNLIENSISHGKASQIVFSYHEEGDSIEISIKDNGIGIPVEDKENIFKKGYGKHTGYGLFFCKEIFNSSKMEIKETGDDNGACFVVTIPESRSRKKKG